MKVIVQFEGATIEEVNMKIIEAGDKLSAADTAMATFEEPATMGAGKGLGPVTTPKFDIRPENSGSASGVKTDSRGMPFDSRIHVGLDKVNKNGTWLNRRIGKDQIAVVEAELRGSAAPAAAVPTLPTPGQVVPFPGMPAQQYQERVEQGNAAALPPFPGAAQAAATPAAPVAPPMGAAHAHSLDTFKKNLPLVLMELTNTNEQFRNYIPTLKAHFKCNELVELMNNDQGLSGLFTTLVQYKFIQSV